MADEFIVVNYGQQIRYFNEETFYKYINEGLKPTRGERIAFTFLAKFPLPTNDSTLESPDRDDYCDWGKDSRGRKMGRYCPFGSAKGWGHTDILVLRNGEVFVPVMKEITRVVREYAPVTDATPGPKLTMPAKKAAKKALAKKRRT